MSELLRMVSSSNAIVVFEAAAEPSCLVAEVRPLAGQPLVEVAAVDADGRQGPLLDRHDPRAPAGPLGREPPEPGIAGDVFHLQRGRTGARAGDGPGQARRGRGRRASAGTCGDAA